MMLDLAVLVNVLDQNQKHVCIVLIITLRLPNNLDEIAKINNVNKNAWHFKYFFYFNREKIVKLEGYLGNTPTMEEHYSMKEQVTDLHSQNILLTERLKEKEDKVMAQIDELRDKVMGICVFNYLFFLFYRKQC